MSVTLPIPTPWQESDEPQRKRWTRDECVALEQAGIVDPESYELIEGELVQKVSKNHPHSRALSLLIVRLVRLFGERIGVEPGIDVSPEDTPTSHPEPDFVLLRRSIAELEGRIVQEEMLVVGEVADSTLAFDLGRKARLYARAAIPEYWVVDVKAPRIIVHRQPEGGTYHSVEAYSGDEKISCLAFPSSEISVREIVG